MSAPSSAAKRTRPAVAVQAPYWLADAAMLRPAIVIFLLSLVAAVAMVGASHLLLASSSLAQLQARQAREAAVKRYAQITDQQRQIVQYQARFLQLQQRGLIGDERRLDWIEAIKQSQAARQLAPITYAIEAQQPLQLENSFDSAGYQLLASRMTLHMEALHEIDLLDLLGDLQRSGGFFTVQECSIKRGGMTASATQASALLADCTLNWLSLGAAGQAAPGAVVAANTRSAP